MNTDQLIAEYDQLSDKEKALLDYQDFGELTQLIHIVFQKRKIRKQLKRLGQKS